MVGTNPRRTTPASIVVVVWNQFKVTSNFLSDLSLILIPEDEVIVVDNGSIDQTPSLLKWWESKLSPQLHIIRNVGNLGFGPGCNQGARIAKREHLILVNNDVQIAGDFIAPMVEFVQEEDPHSITCGRLVDWDSGWNRFGDIIVEYGEAWLLGMLLDVWKLLKGFDERFTPCDFEDVDLSFRARREGVVLKELDLPIHHLGGMTGGKLENRIEITRRHRALFAEKWGLSQ